MAEEQSSEPRIIVDEDWKAQVQREKEEAAKREAQRRAGQEAPLPPASFPLLLTSLATQATMAMGLAPNPLTQKTEVNLDQARHFIDLLGVLEEKTKGNLSTEEADYLKSLLFQLRMQFVQVSSQGAQTGGS